MREGGPANSNIHERNQDILDADMSTPELIPQISCVHRRKHRDPIHHRCGRDRGGFAHAYGVGHALCRRERFHSVCMPDQPGCRSAIVVVVGIVFTLNPVQYFLTSALVQLMRAPSVVTGHRLFGPMLIACVFGAPRTGDCTMYNFFLGSTHSTNRLSKSRPDTGMS